MIRAIQYLTKGDEDYFTYLRKIEENPIAKMVKVVDILMNLTDTPSPKQKEKYVKALAFLSARLVKTKGEKHVQINKKGDGSSQQNV